MILLTVLCAMLKRNLEVNMLFLIALFNTKYEANF